MSTITVKLGAAHSKMVEALAAQIGVAPDELVREAIDAYADVIASAEEQPDFTPEELAAIEEGLAAIRRGELVPHATVVADMRNKFGK